MLHWQKSDMIVIDFVVSLISFVFIQDIYFGDCCVWIWTDVESVENIADVGDVGTEQVLYPSNM